MAIENSSIFMFLSTFGFVGIASKTFLGKVEKVGQVFVSLGVKKFLVVGQFGFNFGHSGSNQCHINGDK